MVLQRVLISWSVASALIFSSFSPRFQFMDPNRKDNAGARSPRTLENQKLFLKKPVLIEDERQGPEDCTYLDISKLAPGDKVRPEVSMDRQSCPKWPFI